MKRVLFITGLAWLLSSCTTQQPVEQPTQVEETYSHEYTSIQLAAQQHNNIVDSIQRNYTGSGTIIVETYVHFE